MLTEAAPGQAVRCKPSALWTTRIATLGPPLGGPNLNGYGCQLGDFALKAGFGVIMWGQL